MTTEAAFPWLTSAPCANGVRLLSSPSAFEALYARVRGQEQRILSDAQVARLPDGGGLWNADEWRLRKQGMQRLLRALQQQGPRLHVLEVGCGNGWLAAAMARDGHVVVGIDAFTTELEQAARVFPQVLFARADLFTPSLPMGAFDAVVFAASLQYFSDCGAALERALDLAGAEGRVHVLDSVLYADEAAARSAQERSAAYFTRMGVPEMAVHYHAHCLKQVMRAGDASVLAAPSRKGIRSWLLRNASSPFTHVVLKRLPA